MKLWEIGAELDAIGMHIVDAGGEILPGVEERLERMEGEFTEKVTRIALLIKEMEANADAAKSEEERLRKIRKSYEASAKSLKDYLKHNMEHFGQPFIKSPRARVRLQRNTQPTLTTLVEPNELAAEFLRLKVEVDKRAALEAWEQTDPDPTKRTAPDGFAIEWGTHIRIS